MPRELSESLALLIFEEGWHSCKMHDLATGGGVDGRPEDFFAASNSRRLALDLPMTGSFEEALRAKAAAEGSTP